MDLKQVIFDFGINQSQIYTHLISYKKYNYLIIVLSNQGF